jgi:hypothetical protein
MSAWETKDIVVVATSVTTLVGTIVVQLMQHVFTARRERLKAVEGIRRDLYQNVIANLDTAIDALADEERPRFKSADPALDSARKILENNPLNVSERFHAACSPFASKEWFDEQMYADRHNTGGVEATVNNMIRTRDKLLRISRKELKIRRSLVRRFHNVTKPIFRRIRREWYMFRVSRKLPARKNT